MHRTIIATAVALGCLQGRSARAQAPPAQPWAPQPVWVLAPATNSQASPLFVTQPRGVDEQRFPFGISGSFTVGGASDTRRGVNALVFAPGLTLDLGVQLTRSIAVFGRASGATLLVFNQGALYGIVEYSPVDWLSLGTGLGWMAIASPVTELSYPTAGSSERLTRGDWGGIAAPLLVSFNIGHRNPMTGRLAAFRIGMEGTLGVEPSTGILGWSSALTLGYAAA